MPRIELKDVISHSFDYTIIGGGTAGLALAARLTEDAEVSVLVLEAGEENLNDPLVLNIGQYGRTLGRKEYDWCSMTTPQVNANDVVFRWSRGRAVGGSSAINFTAFNKPSREDVDAWEKLGNEGWNWDKFDKYMQRATTYTPPNLSEIENMGGSVPDIVKELCREPVGNGPIQVSHPPLPTDIGVKAQQTLQNLGIPMAPAPLGGDPNGVVIGPATINPKTILRSFAANAYWEPNSARPNFNLLTGAVAQRLVTTEIDGELVVTGVEFSHKTGSGETYTAKSSKEVILSAGTLMTPQILELSGIGNPNVLHKVGIPVKLALEGVGENVQDHIICNVVFKLKDGVPVETFDTLHNPEAAKRYKALLTKGDGSYTAGIKISLFAPLSSLSDEADKIISSARTQIEAEIALAKYSRELAEQYMIQLEKLENKVPTCEIIGFPVFFGGGDDPPVAVRRHYSMLCSANSLFSRGTIHIATSDPQVQPTIDPHYFEQEIDLQMLREIVRFGRKMGNTAPLKNYFDETPVEITPGSDVFTDEELTNYLRNNASECFHTTGSASMLPREKGGVVNTNLKVYGTKNLRVADLSIVPLHFGSHSQSVAYGIGEMAADIIKGLA
ncbi:GMC oxidoreductase [Macrolepiota fuliginosa MF-IS2]|uniref:pyranose dehydrogenase (acceptor) n=1 Tax=Macrolepiota fuliginosa MF-IS2 TaxID=1400762 RepID=A0A9P5XC40_9AGAR|nr:GMC oxidoreductase [Macrolepiota fuliginosa MF-IS2]